MKQLSLEWSHVSPPQLSCSLRSDEERRTSVCAVAAVAFDQNNEMISIGPDSADRRDLDICLQLRYRKKQAGRRVHKC